MLRNLGAFEESEGSGLDGGLLHIAALQSAGPLGVWQEQVDSRRPFSGPEPEDPY